MPRYTLTESAKEDLIAIADYGDEHFGIERSNRFRMELDSHFMNIADHPLRYQEVTDIREGYRRSVYEKYSIYYRVVGGGIEIVRILRGQDPRTGL